MIKILGFNHIELYVSNSKHTSFFYNKAFGFEIIAFGDDSTGLKGKVSYILKQGEIFLIITSSVNRECNIFKHVSLYGDGAKDIAFRVENAEQVYKEIINNGGVSIEKPKIQTISGASITKACIKGFGNINHSFLSYNNQYNYDFFTPPYYRNIVINNYKSTTKLQNIDHVALCIPKNNIKNLSDFYCNILDFKETRHETIISGESSMITLVVESSDSTIKLPIVEPQDHYSPLNEFLKFHNIGGVHHVAFSSSNIINTIERTKKNGVNYLPPPSSYYNCMSKLEKNINEDFKKLKENGILIDHENKGYLLQIFTKPLQPFPTFFLEIIQRMGTEGFGSGNIKSLYDAIEIEKNKREI